MKIPSGNGIVSNRQTSTGRVETQATQMAVNGFSAAAGFVAKWKAEDDKAKLQEAINTATKKTNDWKLENMKRTGKSAEKITEDYLNFSRNIENEVSSNLSNESKKMFSQWNLQSTESERMRFADYEHRQKQEVHLAAFNDGVSIAEETIRTDAKQWPKAMEHLGNTLALGKQSGIIKEEEFEAKQTAYMNKMRTELGKAYYTQDKHDFMKNINQFGFGEPEIAAYKDKYQNDLRAEERERKALYSEEAKLIYARRDDMKAQALANEDTSHYFDNAEKLEKMGYKQWATELREEGSQYKEVVSFNSQNRNRPLKEIMEASASLAVGSDLDGSSSKFKANLAIQKEVMKQAKIFDSDPAEYVSKWAQGSTMEEIASSRISLQESQGFYPQKGIQVLTSSEKKNFKGAWESGDVKQKSELVLNAFRYGKHTSKVLEEVGVNSSLALAPLLTDEKDIEMLVAGVSSKPEILDDAQKGDFTSAAKSSEFYNVLVKVQQKFPTNPDLPEKIKDIENTMMGIGARKVDPAAGARFFDERLTTVESSDKLVYFPKTIDEDEVEDHLDRKKQDFIKKFQTGDRIKDNQARWALREATWVNTSNGFALLDSRSGAYLPGSEVDMLELDTVRQELVKAKKNQANDLVSNNRR